MYKISFTDGNNTNWTYYSTETEFVGECHLSFVEKVARKVCSDHRDTSRKSPPFLQSTTMILPKQKNLFFF